MPPISYCRRPIVSRCSEILFKAVAALVILFCIILSGCSILDSKSAPATPNVTVAVSPNAASVLASRRKQFSAIVKNTTESAVTWTASKGNITNSGLFTAPKVTAPTEVVISATSAADPTVTATVTVTIKPEDSVAPPLSIQAPSQETATAGTPFERTLSASGGTPPYSWAIVSGSLPAGIQNTVDGLISGTTKQTGKFNFTVQVTDASSPQQNSNLAIVMNVRPGAESKPGVPNSFFGVHVNLYNSPWPNTFGFTMGGFRSLASQILWSDVNPADGVFDWTKFDTWTGRASASGQDILYTIYNTPKWASSNPTGECSGKRLVGGCYAPNDLNPDGSGSNQHFKDFMHALMNHVGRGRLKYVEIWNEPNIGTEWAGTQAQMLRMAADAYAIVKAADPDIQVLSPPVAFHTAVRNWLIPYFQAGGGKYADVIAIHGYVNLPDVVCPDNCPVPENVGLLMETVRAAMETYGQQNKPLFDTEGGWGITAKVTDSDIQVAFTGRFYLIQIAGTANAKGFDRFYWYGWDIKTGERFYNATTGTVTPIGVAYQQIYNWTLGAQVTPCVAKGTLWTCGVTRDDGYEAVAIWDSSEKCAKGTCGTHDVNVDAKYIQYRDLAGNLTPIVNNAAPVGSKAILLENQNAPVH